VARFVWGKGSDGRYDITDEKLAKAEQVCNSIDYFEGCAFNFVWQGATKIYDFQNHGWNMAWYPFDDREVYIDIQVTDAWRFNYSFPETPLPLSIPEGLGWVPAEVSAGVTSKLNCEWKSPLHPKLVAVTSGFRCTLPKSLNPNPNPN
jgi:hypothetical protein